MLSPSEGELYIIDYFKKIELPFKREYKIDRLRSDTKSFRLADFYVPRYKVYVEFFGQWNMPEHKDRYKEKMRVYRDNQIPVVYIFPENLGFLDYVFRKRLLKLLTEKKMKRQLFLYKLHEFGNRFFEALYLFIAGVIILFFSVMEKEYRDRLIFAVGGTVVLGSLFLFLRAIVKTIRKTKT